MSDPLLDSRQELVDLLKDYRDKKADRLALLRACLDGVYTLGSCDGSLLSGPAQAYGIDRLIRAIEESETDLYPVLLGLLSLAGELATTV